MTDWVYGFFIREKKPGGSIDFWKTFRTEELLREFWETQKQSYGLFGMGRGLRDEYEAVMIRYPILESINDPADHAYSRAGVVLD